MTSTSYGRSLDCRRFCPFTVSPLRHRKPLTDRLPLLNGGRHDASAERLHQSRWSSICIHAYQSPYQHSPGPDRAFSIKISLAKVSGRLDLSWMGLEALDPQIFQLTELKVSQAMNTPASAVDKAEHNTRIHPPTSDVLA